MKLKLVFIFLIGNLIYAQHDARPIKTEKSTVIVEQFYKEPASYNDENTMILKGVSDGEFIEINIQGTINGFKHVKLTMNDSGDLSEIEILHEFEQLSNQTVIIDTVIPEGIPMEKIKWKNHSGKEYEYIIAENGKDGATKKTIFN